MSKVTPELKEQIAAYVKENNIHVLGQVAGKFEITDLEAAQAMPSEFMSIAPKEDFESIWNELTTWKTCLVLVQHLGSVFEIKGPLNKGEYGHGYFNLSGDGPVHGHMQMEDLSNIGFLALSDTSSHTVLFFNDKGEEKFSIFVGRENRILIPEIKDSFNKLKDKYKK